MAGVFQAQALADGQLPTVKTALYTVPAGTTTYLKNVRLYNTGTLQQTILIYINRGTSRQTRIIVLAASESCDFLDPGESVLMSAGHTIEALTTTATTVDYTIDGVTET